VASSDKWCSGAEVLQDCEHAAVVVCGRVELELAEDAADVRLHRLDAEPELVTDRLIRSALGHQTQYLAFTPSQSAERVALAAARRYQQVNVCVSPGWRVRGAQPRPRKRAISTPEHPGLRRCRGSGKSDEGVEIYLEPGACDRRVAGELEKVSPLAASARRISSMALGPIPCS
jgi:hypothetical protein